MGCAVCGMQNTESYQFPKPGNEQSSAGEFYSIDLCDAHALSVYREAFNMTVKDWQERGRILKQGIEVLKRR